MAWPCSCEKNKDCLLYAAVALSPLSDPIFFLGHWATGPPPFRLKKTKKGHSCLLKKNQKGHSCMLASLRGHWVTGSLATLEPSHQTISPFPGGGAEHAINHLTFMQSVCRCAGVQVCRCAGVQVCRNQPSHQTISFNVLKLKKNKKKEETAKGYI